MPRDDWAKARAKDAARRGRRPDPYQRPKRRKKRRKDRSPLDDCVTCAFCRAAVQCGIAEVVNGKPACPKCAGKHTVADERRELAFPEATADRLRLEERP